jgi:nonribosomal peptide synthetase DhbF
MAPDHVTAAAARCVHEAFEEQAERTPAAIALVSGTERLTYADLDARASRLARRLADDGVGRGHIVGIHLERGTDMVVAILAALKAGAGYLMLDPEFPEPRLADMLRDTAAAVVVTRDDPGKRRLTVPARFIEAAECDGPALPRNVGGATPDDVACVMFTSGSTGRPKGVASPHRAITGSVCGQRYLPFGPDSVWLQCAPVSWDVFGLELWGPLLSGGTCVLHPGQRPDPLVIAGLVAEHTINTAFLSSSLFSVIVDEYPEALEGLRDVIVGGEAPSPPHLARAIAGFPLLRLVNGYGPVENMIVVTTHPITADAAAAGPIPIGTPLEGKRAHVLDARLRPVADGQTGELYAAGVGLAHGYLGRPGFTAQRFVACPFGAPGERMYRTGDLVRWHAMRPMEFIGRIDGQVKIRGFRVEPAEVEAALARHPAVARVAVVAAKDHQGENQLVAYVVPRPSHAGDPIETALRTHASAILPGHMVPSGFVVMSTLPLTQNGKLDAAALPPLGQAVARPPGRGPRDPDEEALCELFAQVLGRAPGGIDDSFFDLGGNSLQASRLVSRVRARLGAEISIRAVFEAPTVAAMASRLGAPDTRRLPTRQAPLALPESVPLSFAQRRLWLLDQIDAGVAYTLPVLIRLRGEIDAEALAAAVSDVATRHEALRTVFTVVDGEPVQRVLSGEAARPPFIAVLADAAGMDARVAEGIRHRFDLGTEPPIRVLLLTDQQDNRQHVLLVVLHHIAADGWSLAPLMRDLSQAYAARRDGAVPGWRPLPVQCGGYAIRQRERLGDPADPDSLLAHQLRYWAAAAAGAGDGLAPLRNPGADAVGGSGAGTIRRYLDAETHARLVRLAAEHGITLFMVLQAALAVMLHLAGAGDDIGIGGVVAGRDGHDIDDVVGFFVNMVLLRTDLSGDPAVGELLTRVKESSLEALSHQDAPFDLVVQEINPERLPGRNPLADVVLLLQNNSPARLTLPGADARITVLRPGAARFGVLVEAEDSYAPDGAPDGLTLTVEYQASVFERDVMEWLAAGLTAVLDAMATDPSTRITSATCLPEIPPRAGSGPPRSEPPRPARYEAPRTALERRLAVIWADVLGVDRVGVYDDFFSLGGNSLRAVRVAARIVTSEDMAARADQIFAAPTIAGLASTLAETVAGSPPTIPRVPRVPRAE